MHSRLAGSSAHTGTAIRSGTRLQSSTTSSGTDYRFRRTSCFPDGRPTRALGGHWAPSLRRGGVMRRLILATLISLISTPAFCVGSVECFSLFGKVDCFTSVNFKDQEVATLAAHTQCVSANSGMLCTGPIVSRNFQNDCAAVFVNSENRLFFASSSLATGAIGQALGLCVNSSSGSGFSCRRLALACDGTGVPLPVSAHTQGAPQQEESKFQMSAFSIGKFDMLGSGISFGVGLVIVLLIFAQRARGLFHFKLAAQCR